MMSMRMNMMNSLAFVYIYMQYMYIYIYYNTYIYIYSLYTKAGSMFFSHLRTHQPGTGFLQLDRSLARCVQRRTWRAKSWRRTIWSVQMPRDLGKPWWGTRPEHGTTWNPKMAKSIRKIIFLTYFSGMLLFGVCSGSTIKLGLFCLQKNGFSHSAIKNWDLLTMKVYGKWVNQLKGKLTELDSWPCGWGFFVTCINIISLALGNGTRVRRELSISQVVSSQPWKFTHVWMIYLLYCHFPVIVPWRNMEDVKPWWIWPWR